ncbi:MAG: hypothetical protein VX265_02075, partial [Myxococcota bacterium]|nr:hypothetical protein [Myxococcota bacterium]
MLRAALLSSLLVSCSSDVEPDPCDATCRVESAVSAWARSPQEGAAAMAAVTDPSERMLVARTVMENGHIQGGEVCSFVENPSTQEYCMRLSHRPHLFEAPRQRLARRFRAAGGPVDTELLPAGVVNSPASSASATALADCGEGEDETACADRKAMEAARAGRAGDIAGLCNAIEAPKLRAECRFAAAEAAVATDGPAAVAEAAPLCLAAGEFLAHCLGHIVTRLAERAPEASAGPGAWHEVIAGSEAMAASLQPFDRALATSAANRVYAEAAALAYARAGAIDGAPFDALPTGAAPAVRASLAWELVRRGELRGVSDLDTAVAVLAEAETRRRPGVPALPSPAEVIVRNRWGADDPVSQSFAASWWRGTARRPTHHDPDIDRALSVLEAVADIRGPAAPMLTAAIQHSERVV